VPDPKLDGHLRRTLSRALLSAFPKRRDLELMLGYSALELSLDDVAEDGPYPHQVFELIQWAEAHGKVLELVGAACEENRGNDDLASFAALLDGARAKPVDLSEYVTIHDQGVEGSVVAMAVVTAMETSLARSGQPRSLSARYLFEKARRYDDLPPTAQGGYFEAVLYVAQFFGVPDEEVWPYVPLRRSLPKSMSWKKLEAAPRTRARAFRLEGVKDIPFHLEAGRPIVAGVPVYKGAWLTGEVLATGRIAADFDTWVGGHGVTIVGYDPVSGEITFANSWGPGWGRGGFGTLTREVVEKVLIADPTFGNEMHAVEVAP
jgi:hypothetical protein